MYWFFKSNLMAFAASFHTEYLSCSEMGGHFYGLFGDFVVALSEYFTNYLGNIVFGWLKLLTIKIRCIFQGRYVKSSGLSYRRSNAVAAAKDRRLCFGLLFRFRLMEGLWLRLCASLCVFVRLGKAGKGGGLFNVAV
jgi:hypothetical protein